MKIDIEEVISALQVAKIDKTQQGTVLNYLQDVAKEIEAQKQAEKLPNKKNEWGVILFSNVEGLKDDNFTAAIYQIPVGADHGLVLGKVSQAARDQVLAAKRKKYPISTMGEAVVNVKRKFLKEKNVNIKTKQTVRVLVSNNQLV
jgi:hypothetical protein